MNKEEDEETEFMKRSIEYKLDSIKKGNLSRIEARNMLMSQIEDYSQKKNNGIYWKPIDTIPQDGTEVLVCNTKQNSIMNLIRWNKIHKYWESKGRFISSMQSDLWAEVTKPKENLPFSGD